MVAGSLCTRCIGVEERVDAWQLRTVAAFVEVAELFCDGRAAHCDRDQDYRTLHHILTYAVHSSSGDIVPVSCLAQCAKLGPVQRGHLPL